MNIKLKFILLFTLLTFISCSTPYKSHGLAGGYQETQLGKNVWKILFRGNGYTSAFKTEEFALLRSAELTKKNGFNFFITTDSDTKLDKFEFKTSPSAITTFNGNVNNGVVSGTGYTTVFEGTTTTVNRASTSFTVIMFETMPKYDGVIYDATFICSNLGAKHKVICNEGK